MVSSNADPHEQRMLLWTNLQFRVRQGLEHEDTDA